MPAEPALTAEPAGNSGAAGPADSPDPLEFRRAMAEFATGVTVVTAIDGDEPVGFACQSFASVSLEPPLILFCADRRGRSWPRIRSAGRFCVNVLGEDQADLCARFGSSRGLKYEGLEWDLSPHGTPQLRDVLLNVHAEVHAVHEAGDHDVVIGRVLSVRVHEAPGAVWRRPMLFFRSRFGVHPPEVPFAPDPWGEGDRWGWG
ncbi:flavin reductase family protein [Actinomadura violacea]|nr:flavin reductase family protein [Actinomadura violacea]MBO2458773.1 flavin reductase family protein [Actinomadura violacea]